MAPDYGIVTVSVEPLGSLMAASGSGRERTTAEPMRDCLGRGQDRAVDQIGQRCPAAPGYILQSAPKCILKADTCVILRKRD